MRSAAFCRVVPTWLSTAVVAALLAVAAPASADDPQPVPSWGPSEQRPWELATHEQRTYSFHVVGTGTPSTTTITVTGDGVGAQVPAQSVDSTDDVDVPIRFTATPGAHHVTVAFDRDGYATRILTYTVWADGDGGPHLDGHDSLARQRWVDDVRTYSEGRVQHYHAVVFFIDDTWAYADRPYVGWPRGGVPARCSSAVPGCVHYWYDAASGFVELDHTAIGAVVHPDPGADLDAKLGDDLYVDGMIPWGDEWDDGNALLTRRLGFYGAGHRLQGTWQWLDRNDMPENIGEVRLRLWRDGRYVLRTQYDIDDHWAVRRGHYRLGRYGLLRLHRGAKTRKLTMAVCLDETTGAKAPQECLAIGMLDVGMAGGGIFLPLT
ncbi:hypothetical protein [Nocardioides acrostichi]|uniref:Uncharacterized protein n=1 Tax=Nocardioides acrostichi TaxID=2784339 RepID=A0A930UZ60_9ACTN|nr:hypothetical protein [Nocardioides acrostichi]MBF4161710.1 hypothetical protein [Nocardioides acrostichi]